MFQMEKREFVRKKMQNLTIFELVGSKGNIFNRGMGCARNISANGILIETHMPMTFGRALLLAVGFEEKILELKGKVARVQPHKGKRYHVGIEFVGLSQFKEKELIEFLKARNQTDQWEAFYQ